uniref:Uncharacterized protein n=3 Tax=Triticinae TaxID=1648030 RepID=A0A452ZRQ7_AEGTS
IHPAVAVGEQSREPSSSPSSAALLFSSARMDKVKSHGSKQRRSGRGRISRMLRQQKARLYIIQRCVVMLLCYHD